MAIDPDPTHRHSGLDPESTHRHSGLDPESISALQQTTLKDKRRAPAQARGDGKARSDPTGELR